MGVPRQSKMLTHDIRWFRVYPDGRVFEDDLSVGGVMSVDYFLVEAECCEEALLLAQIACDLEYTAIC